MWVSEKGGKTRNVRKIQKGVEGREQRNVLVQSLDGNQCGNETLTLARENTRSGMDLHFWLMGE